jgi:hypothetical protein
MPLSPEQIRYFTEHASDSLQPNLTASGVAGLVLAYTFVGLRVWARKAGKTPLGHDDWLIIAALVPLSGYRIAGWIAISFGAGKHIIFVTNPAGYIKAFVASITSYALCVVLTKLSILFFYCRIFFPVQSLRYISWSIGIVTVLYNLALILVTALQCIPLSAMWTGEPGRCIDTLPPFTTLGIINVVTDVAILALPIRYVLQLRLSVTERIQICGIFLLGAVVCVFGIIRVVALAQAAPGDPSYNQTWSGIWSFCEISIGIVAACLPTLAILVTKLRLSRVSNSVIHLMSITFSRGSGSSSRINTTASGREIQANDNQYAQLSERSLVRGRSAESEVHKHEGIGEA